MLKNRKKHKSIFLSLFLALFAFVFIGGVVIFQTTSTVHASLSGSLSDSGINLTQSGNAAWVASSDTIDGSVTGQAAGTCSSAKSKNGTITIKNAKSNTGTLSFNYTLTLNGGSATIDGTSKTANGSFSKQLAANATVAIKITSAAAGTTTSIKITGIQLVVDIQTTTYFSKATNGDYSVTSETGWSVTSVNDYSGTPSNTQSSAKSYTLVAKPNSGYKLVEWNLTKNSTVTFLSSSSTYVLNQDVDGGYISAKFALSSAATFKTGGKYYYDLAEANTVASSGDKKIIVEANGTVPAGNYSISSGVMLVIPYNAAATVNSTKTQPVVVTSYTTPSAFRVLTLASGCNITVSGSIYVASQVCSNGQFNGKNGQPSGPGGRIEMKSGSNITINSSAILYCWGFIYGSGFIEALSGSTIYECFQIKNFRGGTLSNNMNGNSYKVFPFNQYYVQNIEVSLKINTGATEGLFTTITTGAGTANSSFTFISSSDGLFRLSSGYLIKRYEPSTDRLIVDAVNATLALSSFSVKVYINVSTSSYVLPLTNNITINLQNSLVTTSQDLCFFPGTVFNIDETSTFRINNNKSVYVYDVLDWDSTSNFYVVGYTVANGTTTKRTAAGLKAAEIDINGTVEVTSGAHFYTTTSGAFIHSSEKSGKITFDSISSNGVTYQTNSTGGNSANYYSMDVVNAILTNGDGTHYSGDVVKGEMILYDEANDKWGKTEQEGQTITVNFSDDKNPSNSFAKSYIYPTETFIFPTQTEAGFTDSDGYKLRRWVGADGSFYYPEDEYDGAFEEGTVFKAYYGGWFTDINGVTSYTYRTSAESPSYPYGIATVEKINGSGTETYLFLENGVLSNESKVVLNTNDGKYYYFEFGVLGRDAGLIKDYLLNIYYFVQSDGTVLASGTYYLDNKLNGLLPSGYYRFGSDGKMVNENGEIMHIDSSNDNRITDSLNSLPLSNIHGLFAMQHTLGGTTHIIYVDALGKAVVNKTFYVTNGFINGYSVDGVAIVAGLYYFDANGYMHDASFDLIAGTLSGTDITTGGGN